jgi:hypothetical protein
MKRKTKKEMVLEIYDREAMGEVTAREIAIINRGLVEEFGEGGAMAPAEIARLLVDEDLPVRFEQVFRMASTTEKYELLFEGFSLNESLAEAEASLREINDLYRKFQRLGDRTGARFARQTAERAKRNAASLSRSARLTEFKRAEQQEIAQWFSIWLQTPDLFTQWLELRKSAPGFKLFSSRQPTEHTGKDKETRRQGDKETGRGGTRR